MPDFHVKPDELTAIAGRIHPCGQDVTAAGQTLGGNVSGTVGLPDLDGTLDSLSAAFSAWLLQAGTDLVTLSYDTEAAGLAYATVENEITKGAQGSSVEPGHTATA
jgi:hypothetical protein